MVSDATKATIGTLIDVVVIFSVSFFGILAGAGTAVGLGLTDQAPDPIGAAFGAAIFSLFKSFLYLAKIRGIDKDI